MVLTGLMAALVFVGSMLRVTLPVAVGGTTSFHLGNIMAVLSGLLLGPVGGGLASGIGSALCDVINPLYTYEIPFTFFNKLAMGAIAGWLSHRGGKNGESHGWNFTAAVTGTLVYYVLYFAKSFFYNGIILEGLQPLVALASLVMKLPASLFNGILAVAAGVPLATAVRKALRKSGVLLPERRGKESGGVPNRGMAWLGAVILASAVAIGAVCWYHAVPDPWTALDRKTAGMDTIFQAEMEVWREETGGYTLLFYLNREGGVNCAAMKQGPLGWRVAEVSGEVPVTDTNVRVGLLWSRIGKTEDWMFYGVVYDPEVKTVEWSGVTAKVNQIGERLVVCAAGTGIEAYQDYRIYDGAGNELRHLTGT